MSAFGIGKLALGAAGAAVVVAFAAGCASSSSKTSAGAGSLKTKSTSIGAVLVDSSGHTVYELVGDTAANQTCTADCLTTWPEVKVNGTQLVVNGHPAFTFSGDSAAGQTKGQNVTDQWGVWLALGAGGNPIGAGSAPGSTSPGSQPSATKSSAPGGGGPAF